MINELTKLADYLNSKGLKEEADNLDVIIEKYAAGLTPDQKELIAVTKWLFKNKVRAVKNALKTKKDADGNVVAAVISVDESKNIIKDGNIMASLSTLGKVMDDYALAVKSWEKAELPVMDFYDWIWDYPEKFAEVQKFTTMLDGLS